MCPRWSVILHHDDVNNFGYVIKTLQIVLMRAALTQQLICDYGGPPCQITEKILTASRPALRDRGLARTLLQWRVASLAHVDTGYANKRRYRSHPCHMVSIAAPRGSSGANAPNHGEIEGPASSDALTVCSNQRITSAGGVSTRVR